jgi:hypothetical protein
VASAEASQRQESTHVTDNARMPGTPESSVLARSDATTARRPPVSGPRSGGYQSPVVIAIGSVRQATKGSAASGHADANSQFYW